MSAIFQSERRYHYHFFFYIKYNLPHIYLSTQNTWVLARVFTEKMTAQKCNHNQIAFERTELTDHATSLDTNDSELKQAMKNTVG